MLKKVEDIKFRMNGILELNEEISKEINCYYEEFKNKNPSAYNEKIIVVTNFNNVNSKFEMEVKETLFSSVLYAKHNKKIKIRPLFSAGYIVTKDNYVGIVLNQQYILSSENTLNLVGGMAGTQDIIDGEYKSEECLKRELKEELGFDLINDKFEYKLKYLKFPSDKDENISCYPIGTIYEIRTKYTKDELSNIFDKNIHDSEVKDIIYFSKDNYKDIFKYKNRKEYLVELLKNLFIN